MLTHPAARLTPSEPELARHGVRVQADAVSQHRRGRQTLHTVDLSVEPGEVLAIVGASGAGKTTLLETLAGLRPPSSGSVRFDGRDAYDSGADAVRVGYAPQEDIIHHDLPLRRTLRYAARLRLPAGTPSAVADRIVEETMAELDLSERADVRVGALSGGQRKRASIAVEMLTRPGLFFLDEPTSGLDPATSGEVLRLLHRLAEHGTTIVLTTHAPSDIDLCDRVVFLAREGHVAFVGTPAEARHHFDVHDLARAYDRLVDAPPAAVAAGPAARGDEHSDRAAVTAVGRGRAESRGGAGATVGAMRQWTVLTARNADLLVRNRLTLAVLAGSPALVVAMMALLFQPGSVEAGQSSVGPPVQTVFWVAFAGFFFGLTYGLLQIVGETAIFRRERLAGLRVGAYVGSKVAVLTPVLVGVAVVMLTVLRGLDRLPDAGWDVYAALLVTLVLEALAALALGLLASAAVNDAAQATLALPMICFPQVLFAGAVVPVPDMAGAGQVLSHGLANRWAFESIGRSLGLDGLLAGQVGAEGYGPAFTGSAAHGWLVLVISAGMALLATGAVLRAKSRHARLVR
jgi:ABC transport system ATP-binding/permease protein